MEMRIVALVACLITSPLYANDTFKEIAKGARTGVYHKASTSRLSNCDQIDHDLQLESRMWFQISRSGTAKRYQYDIHVEKVTDLLINKQTYCKYR